MIGRAGILVPGELADALRFAAPARPVVASGRGRAVLQLALSASMIPVARACVGG
ncbi:hypothetical protein [uncultured Sphingomonas sp.]|uniref:hypothetical protein n=1 Tax=uncultured Sphingomonas sp. TaxID=158754 RepID=UPI0025CF895C|nr:hypothetical protein [uncultured Sphingomonas sp.]